MSPTTIYIIEYFDYNHDTLRYYYRPNTDLETVWNEAKDIANKYMVEVKVSECTVYKEHEYVPTKY